MGRELAQTVVLTDDNGVPVIFYAGDEPEKKYADQITNPKAWGDDAGGKTKAAEAAEPADAEEVVKDDVAADADGDGRPAKSAVKQEWVDYAASKGVELEDGSSKQDYIDAVDAL